MIFNYRKEYELNPLKLGNNAIERCEYTKCFGINVDEKLSFKFHIDHIVNKISKTVGILFKLNKLLPKNILMMLYNSLILPYFNYCIGTWYNTTQLNLNRLRVLQKKAVRAIYSAGFNLPIRLIV